MRGPSRWPRPAGPRRHRRPAILMSESQEIDRPRVWWKELIKKRRVRLFDAALVGGPAHRDYLVQLGMPPDRIALGYNAVDNDYFADAARRWRNRPDGRVGLARRPVLPDRLPVRAREEPGPTDRGVRPVSTGAPPATRPGTWCSAATGRDGTRSNAAVAASGFADADPPAGLPPGRRAAPLVCPRRGVRPAEPDGALGTGRQRGRRERPAPGRLAPRRLCRDARAGPARDHRRPLRSARRRGDGRDARRGWRSSTAETLEAMGRRAAEVVSLWGPDRFADGVVEALELARTIVRGARRDRPPWSASEIEVTP